MYRISTLDSLILADRKKTVQEYGNIPILGRVAMARWLKASASDQKISCLILITGELPMSLQRKLDHTLH
ncbi:hypothetical protein EVAR_5738_1 [Eumeta japonica]|uniref:Uncharacterized protein n=1 Tax=Eumeta variegata TaxID=151549 RepID=A0A4C1T747_EUMVA|nr:hypothetical protein EVAR_5738_1 [Eumeta japonica]